MEDLGVGFGGLRITCTLALLFGLSRSAKASCESALTWEIRADSKPSTQRN